MDHFRLLVVYIPLAALPIGLALSRLNAIAALQRFRRTTLQSAAIITLAALLPVACLASYPWQRFSNTLRPAPLLGYEVLAPMLKPALKPSDILCPEALGYFSYVLLDQYVHDMCGLTDRHIATYGKERSVFGRYDFSYTANVVRPHLYLIHDPGKMDRLQKAYAGDFRRDYTCFRWQREHSAPIWIIMRRGVQDRLIGAIGNVVQEIEWDNPG